MVNRTNQAELTTTTLEGYGVIANKDPVDGWKAASALTLAFVAAEVKTATATSVTTTTRTVNDEEAGVVVVVAAS